MPRDPKTRTRLTEQARQQVWSILGHECALRGIDNIECDGPMEVDHVYGREYKLHKLASYNRWRRYLKEAQAGLLRGLCKAHNERIRPTRGRMPTAATLDPF